MHTIDANHINFECYNDVNLFFFDEISSVGNTNSTINQSGEDDSCVHNRVEVILTFSELQLPFTIHKLVN